MQGRLAHGDGAGRVAPPRGLGLVGQGVQQTVGGPGHGGDCWDAEPLVDRGPFGVVDPGHDALHSEHLPGDTRGDDVGVVPGRHRSESIGVLNPRAQQDIPVKAHAGDLLAGEFGGKPVKGGPVTVDDRHFMPESRQRLGKGGADPAAAHHHYPHL